MTSKIRKLSPLDIHTWGGFAESGGDMSSLLTDKKSNVALVGGGSGINYLIDAILLLSEMQKFHPEMITNQPRAHIVFTTRDLTLFQFFVGVCQHALGENCKLARVFAYLTCGCGANHGIKNFQDSDQKFAWG